MDLNEFTILYTALFYSPEDTWVNEIIWDAISYLSDREAYLAEHGFESDYGG